MTQLRPTLDKAGRFPVEQIACHHFSDRVLLNAPRAAVLHTVEGSFESALTEFKTKFAPHFLIGLDKTHKPRIVQCVPVGYIGAALEHENNLAIVQIEMAGFSSEQPWIPDEVTMDILASMMLACRDIWGVPLTRPWKDGDYGRYGNNPHRQSGFFGKKSGWFGHGDIPENRHWDPGNLTWSTVFARAHALDGGPASVPIASAPTATAAKPA